MRTRELARHLGVSYRQLDYLARRPELRTVSADLAGATGSGTRRHWSPEVVARLEIAGRLADVSGQPWGILAAAVMRSPEPPLAGWALLDGGGVHFAADEYELVEALAEVEGGIVARFGTIEARTTVAA